MRYYGGAIVGIIALCTPLIAAAFPFGGQAISVIFCYNSAIYAYLTPPIGGPYVWTPATKTYEFGPPKHVGQWLLGLASPPYYCLVSISPVIVFPGTAITMMGSSGPAAAPYSTVPASPSLSLGGSSGGSSGTNGANSSGSASAGSGASLPTSIGHVVISEVFAHVDAAHGSAPLNQWVELYNGGTTSQDLSGWKLITAAGTSTIPSGTALASGKFLVLVATKDTASYWTVPENVGVTAFFTSEIAGGFETAGDALTLKSASGAAVDALSWGSDKSIFNPSVPAAATSSSMVRSGLSLDTNTASDWVVDTSPAFGQ